ncbi:MAG: hypothetical protein IPJ34_40275 [Myxococcales bacterium]|nr:hypothetical protein [Myxococcales bacterium]
MKNVDARPPPPVEETEFELVTARAALVSAARALRTRLYKEAGLDPAEAVGRRSREQREKFREISATIAEQSRCLYDESGMGKLEAHLATSTRADREWSANRPRIRNPNAFASKWVPQNCSWTKARGPTLTPDEKLRTLFVDRSTDDEFAVGFGLSNRPGQGYPLVDDFHSPFYMVSAKYDSEWAIAVDHSQIYIPLEVDFDNYFWWVSGRSEGGPDDWGFAGLFYRVSIWIWDKTATHRVAGTETAPTNSLFANTKFKKHGELRTNAYPAPGKIPDIHMSINYGFDGEYLVLRPGEQVCATLSFILYTQTYGDAAHALFDIDRFPGSGKALLRPLPIQFRAL